MPVNKVPRPIKEIIISTDLSGLLLLYEPRLEELGVAKVNRPNNNNIEPMMMRIYFNFINMSLYKMDTLLTACYVKTLIFFIYLLSF